MKTIVELLESKNEKEQLIGVIASQCMDECRWWHSDFHGVNGSKAEDLRLEDQFYMHCHHFEMYDYLNSSNAGNYIPYILRMGGTKDSSLPKNLDFIVKLIFRKPYLPKIVDWCLYAQEELLSKQFPSRFQKSLISNDLMFLYFMETMEFLFNLTSDAIEDIKKSSLEFWQPECEGILKTFPVIFESSKPNRPLSFYAYKKLIVGNENGDLLGLTAKRINREYSTRGEVYYYEHKVSRMFSIPRKSAFEHDQKFFDSLNRDNQKLMEKLGFPYYDSLEEYKRFITINPPELLINKQSGLKITMDDLKKVLIPSSLPDIF